MCECVRVEFVRMWIEYVRRMHAISVRYVSIVYEDAGSMCKTCVEDVRRRVEDMMDVYAMQYVWYACGGCMEYLWTRGGYA